MFVTADTDCHKGGGVFRWKKSGPSMTKHIASFANSCVTRRWRTRQIEGRRRLDGDDVIIAPQGSKQQSILGLQIEWLDFVLFFLNFFLGF